MTRDCDMEKVSDLTDITNCCWDVQKINCLFSQATTQKILQLSISWRNGPDVFWWPHARSGMYSVKSGYFIIRQKGIAPNLGPSTSMGIPQSIWKIIWNIKVPQKLKHFL